MSMQSEKMFNTMTRKRIIAARLVAISADLLQIGLFPVFGEGIISPLNDILDIVVCAILSLLIGWHFAFLPSFMLELAPMLDVVPTWTIAVLLATRQKRTAAADSTRTTWGSVSTEDDLATPPANRPEARKLLPTKAGQERGSTD